jgi:hypothetical protein
MRRDLAALFAGSAVGAAAALSEAIAATAAAAPISNNTIVNLPIIKKR